MRGNEKSQEISVLVEGEAWRHVASLTEANANDAVYLVMPDGTLVFGDGAHGRRPDSGADLVISYRQSRGTVGELG